VRSLRVDIRGVTWSLAQPQGNRHPHTLNGVAADELGIIGTGLLAVPVLAGSAAYAVAEAFGLRGSLELPANRALGFYGIVGSATLAGAALAATNIDPIAMLFWTAVINGVIAVPLMFAMMFIVSSRRGLEAFALPAWLRVLGWLASALMALTLALFLWSNTSS